MKRFAASILAMSLLVFTGCSGSKNATAPEKQDQRAPASSEPVTLELWNPDNRDTWLKALDGAIKRFESENKHIKIKVVTVPWGDYDTKLQAARVTKTLPDIVYSFRGYAADWAYQGLTTPVDDVLDKVGRTTWNGAQLQYATYQNKVYAVPMVVYPQLVFYRKDWYAEKGLKVPTTWDELLSNVTALNDPAKQRYGFLMYNKHPDSLVILNLMATNSAYTFDQEGKVAINSPETIEALKMTAELTKSAPPGALTKSQQDQRMSFVAGLGGHLMASLTTADVIAGKEGLLQNVGAFPVPINKGDRGALAEFAGWAVTEGAKHKAEAKQFLETFFRDDVQLEFAQNNIIGFLPAQKNISENDAYWNSARIKPFKEIFQAAIEVTKNGEMPGQRFGPNKWAGTVQSNQVWTQMVDMVVVEGKDPKEAAAWADKEVREIAR